METDLKTTKKSLRLWPGIIIVALQWFLRYALPEISPDAIMIAVLSGILGGLAVIVWWAFFSRAPRFERWFAIVLMIAAFLGTAQILDKSIATANMGLMFTIFSIPVLSLGFVVWAVVTRNLSLMVRRITMFAAIILATGFWGLLRTKGMTGQNHHEFAWRWSKTAEEEMLTKQGEAMANVNIDSTLMAGEPEWPGFRGANRDGIIHGLKIEADWKKSPPAEIWRRKIGPACSSFSVHGILLYTQEQRGEFEEVSCYNIKTGEPIWRHQDSARFWDSHAGAGPRSTPTLYKNRVYTLGATGILNALDAYTGKLIWTRNAAADTKVTIPGWGYTSSPLIVDSMVLIAISGQILAYDNNSGKLLWTGTDGGESYSSPHLVTIDGEKQVLFVNKNQFTSYSIEDGKELWKIAQNGPPILQPSLIANNTLLLSEASETGGKGMICVNISNKSGKWAVNEQWKSRRMRPYFNDFIYHKNFIYGFEGPSLTCIDATSGELKWKGDRYAGEILLLADQDLLIVLTEQGEIALVKANPLGFNEIYKFQAIEGKTWNHPVLVNDILVVRNAEEMAAFRLAVQGT